MKITVKTLQQKVFQIDTEGSDTVADLKKKIQESQGHPIDTQKIIYSGKVLPDTKTVESCEIKEKDFLVLMVSKPKTAPAASSSSTAAAAPASPAPSAPSAPTPAAAPVAPSATAAPSPAPAAPVLTPVPPAAPSQANPLDPSTSFLSGDALQSSINNMIEMGFAREEVMRALRASFNNPERAVEYLMTGIPPGLETERPAAENPAPSAAPRAAAPAAAAAAQVAGTPASAQQPPSYVAPPNQPQNLFQLAQQQQQQGGGAPGEHGGLPGQLGGIDLEALRNSPQIQQLRDLVRQNPALVQPLIQQLAAANPGLAQVLAAHPELLASLLGGEDLEGGEGGPGFINIEVTPEENAAIERLEALGFPRQVVIEAYFACDKNEELAANYLFENGFEE